MAQPLEESWEKIWLGVKDQLRRAGLDGNPERVLHHAGFEPPTVWKRYAFQAMLVVAGFFMGVVSGTQLDASSVNWIGVIGVLTTLITITLAFSQWRAVRREATFERYYDRIDLANRRMARISEAKANLPSDSSRSMTGEGWLTPFELLVFAELDNLEYASEKYKLGYMKPELAARSLRHFYARCIDEKQGELFREKAIEYIQVLGYEKSTRVIVEKLLKKAVAEVKRK